jgi:protein-serine/threonine kinase
MGADEAEAGEGTAPEPDIRQQQQQQQQAEATAAANRGRSSSSSSAKPRMLSQVGNQKSTGFIHRMFHPKEAAAAASSGSSDRGGLRLDLPPAGIHHAHGSPPITPGSPSVHNTSGPPSIAASRSPSRAASVRRDSATTPGGGDPYAIQPAHLADRLSQVGLKAPGRPAHPGSHPSSNAISPPLEPSVPPTPGTEKGRFNFKDLVSSGPKLSRKPSASSAASKSEKGAKSNAGSEKGGYDGGGSTASLLAKYGVCEKTAIGKGATAVVRLAHKWDRREEKLYAVKVRPSPAFPNHLLLLDGSRPS